MSADDKLQLARLVVFGLTVIVASLIWAYSGDLSEMLVNQTAELLGDSFNKMGGIARR